MVKVKSWPKIFIAILFIVSIVLLSEIFKLNSSISYTSGYLQGISQCSLSSTFSALPFWSA